MMRFFVVFGLVRSSALRSAITYAYKGDSEEDCT
jgi:hypothetical protein